jgi:hypothetical protein
VWHRIEGISDRDLWSRDLQEYIEDTMRGNGVFEECLIFVPDLKEAA